MRPTYQSPPLARVLVVEDDPTIRAAVEEALRGAGYEVRSEEQAAAAEAAVVVFRPDLVVLDVGLPNGANGLTLARRIRASDDVPIVFSTSAGSERERLDGFALGADDYLVKPYPMSEMVARVGAVLRRSQRLTRAVWRVGDVVVDEEAHIVTVNDQPVELTALEFSILACLCRTPGRVISKVQLLTEVWGFDHYSLNVVEVHVSALRRKLEAHGPRVIRTVRNVGYVVRG